MLDKYLVIDLSRTKLRYAVLTKGLDLIEEGNEYLLVDSKEGLFQPIKNVCDRVRGTVDGVSITMPGVIDREKGIAYSGGVFEWIRDMNFADELSEYVGMPVVIANDAKAACMAEMGYGSLKNIQNGVLLMILNTGIGGAVVTEGHLLNGHHFGAGEFSYLRGSCRSHNPREDMFALQCSLDGLSNSVEMASGRKNLNILRIISKMRDEDEDVIRGVNDYCDMLATYIYNLQCVLDADVFVLGGHITDDPIMMKAVQSAVDRKFEEALYPNIVKPRIKECVFHNNSRRYGAVYNYIQVMEKKNKGE